MLTVKNSRKRVRAPFLAPALIAGSSALPRRVSDYDQIAHARPTTGRGILLPHNILYVRLWLPLKSHRFGDAESGILQTAIAKNQRWRQGLGRIPRNISSG